MPHSARQRDPVTALPCLHRRRPGRAPRPGGLTPGQRLRTRAAAAVLGFRTTSYVTSELIDWSAAPGDPIYRLVFPAEAPQQTKINLGRKLGLAGARRAAA